MIIGFFSDHAPSFWRGFGLRSGAALEVLVQGNLSDDGSLERTRALGADDVADIGNENDQAS